MFSGNPQLTLLIRNIVLTATLGLLQTSLVYIGEIKTAERGRDYYLRIIEKTPYYERLSKESFHVVDRVSCGGERIPYRTSCLERY